MKLTEIIQRNRELGSKLSGDKYSILILSNITINQIKDILEFNLRKSGVNAYVEIGNFDSILHDSQNTDSYDAVLIIWELSNIIENFHVKCNLMDEDLFNDLQAKIEGEIGLLLSNLKKTPLVLISKFSSLAFDFDVIGNNRYNNLSRKLNSILEAASPLNTKLINTDFILATTGLDSAVDYRQYQTTKALYSISFYNVFIEFINTFFLSSAGYVKKVLIMDCDNTLWSGILGEDGCDGIKMSCDSIQGKPFCEVQNIIKHYKNSGLLLALCSKNNQDDVDEVLDHHCDMILSNDDFVIKKVNWNNKAKNIQEIASELNLNLESFVFIDDSKFEIGLVKKELPQVECILVPDNLSEFPTLVRKLISKFDFSKTTAEDYCKTEMYRQENLRNIEKVKYNSIDEYLSSLELNVSVLWGGEVPIARACQLTQKTNQFNLTTKRYTEVELQCMLNSDSYIMATFSVQDKYGDYGVVGLVILKRKQNTQNEVTIDTFLMSCRVIGRNVEFTIFSHIVNKLIAFKVDKLNAMYIETEKNKQVSNFYDSLGFEVILNSNKSKQYQFKIRNFRNISNEIELNE